MQKRTDSFRRRTNCQHCPFAPIVPFLLTYRAGQLPTSPALLGLPVEVGVFAIVLEFWVYRYHWLSHEIPFLGRLHRSHHLAIRPSISLAYLFDVPDVPVTFVILPVLTMQPMRIVGVPLGFYSFWVCSSYSAGIKAGGHSGILTYSPASSPAIFTWLLSYFDAELIVEDHDLHHRVGFKKHSGNYGKQTRLWDRLFGTCLPRVECTHDNVDFENPVSYRSLCM